MNNILKSTLALALAAVIGVSATSCSKSKKSKLDLAEFPLVYADENGLEAINEGETEPTLITGDFYTFLNAENKVQAAANDKIYYIETENKKTTLGKLCAYDVKNKKTQVLHEGVYSFKVSHDGECIIFSDGTGSIYKYNKRSEKKDNYTPIQSKGVSAVCDISADGKYVLYSQVLQSTNYYTLTLAKTDYTETEEAAAMDETQKSENKNLSKAPVIVAKNFKEYLGGADDLSVFYYTKMQSSENGEDHFKTLHAFQKYSENVVLSDTAFEKYNIDENGEIIFSTAQKQTKTVSDIVTDKYEEADAQLKKENASASEWKEKTQRDNIREKITSYLSNIATTTFYKFNASSNEPEQFLELYGQLSFKGVDEEYATAFFGTNLYDFAAAEKPDINDVTAPYKLFDAIKSRHFALVNANGMIQLEAGEGIGYNSADCFVDTQAKTVRIIMNFDYLGANKVGTLYNVDYTQKGFEKAKLISENVTKVAHFNSGEDNYFADENAQLCKNDFNTVLMKGYAYSSNNPLVKVAFTSDPTGKTDDYGNEITEDTAYLIQDDQSVKLGKIFTDKGITCKGNMFAFYTTYDYKNSAGEMVVYNGEKVVNAGKNVTAIYKFS